MAKKIIIVEDDTFLQGLISGKLSKEGFTVIAVSDGGQANAKIEEETPDLVLLDLMVPTVDGFGILEKVRSTDKVRETPVIIFSNLGEEKDIKHAKELGATDFMVKSNFTLDELALKIKEILG